MTLKTEIIAELGEEALLLPALVEQALIANERAKYCFSLLQTARQRVEQPGRVLSWLRAEREAAGIEEPAFDEVVPGAEGIGDGRYRVPHLERILGLAQLAIDEMVRPLAVSGVIGADQFQARREALSAVLQSGDQGGRIDRARIGAITSGDRSAGDSPHLLVMDLHRALIGLVERLACESIDGAHAYLLDDNDRGLVSAFMHGLNRTAPLRFGHPGLDTTAIRAGERLLIQNEIGVTGAHVLVVSVAGTTVTVTCTDVHLPRLSFFQSLLDTWGIEWAETVPRPAPDSQDNGVFHLLIGRFAPPDRNRCDAFLEHVGSRVVFLIDWNKARRHLRAFLSDRDAVAVLGRAAADEVGHRAFLELGGADLVDGALGPGAQRSGCLDRYLGRERAVETLCRVLGIAADGLLGDEPRPVIEDRCRTELRRVLDGARAEALDRCTAHATLVLEAAEALRDSANALRSGSGTDHVLSNAARARRREHEADLLAVDVYLLLVPEEGGFADLVAAQDEALEALGEGCFHAALLDDGSPLPEEVAEMAGLAVSAGRAYLRALSFARRNLAGGEEFLAEADRVVAIAEECESACRRAGQRPADEGSGNRRLHACAGLVRSIAASTAALGMAVSVLRDGV